MCSIIRPMCCVLSIWEVCFPGGDVWKLSKSCHKYTLKTFKGQLTLIWTSGLMEIAYCDSSLSTGISKYWITFILIFFILVVFKVLVILCVFVIFIHYVPVWFLFLVIQFILVNWGTIIVCIFYIFSVLSLIVVKFYLIFLFLSFFKVILSFCRYFIF